MLWIHEVDQVNVFWKVSSSHIQSISAPLNQPKDTNSMGSLCPLIPKSFSNVLSQWFLSDCLMLFPIICVYFLLRMCFKNIFFVSRLCSSLFLVLRGLCRFYDYIVLFISKEQLFTARVSKRHSCLCLVGIVSVLCLASIVFDLYLYLISKLSSQFPVNHTHTQRSRARKMKREKYGNITIL